MEVTFVVIDDTISIKEHPLLYTLEDKYKNVEFFLKPEDGLNFITSHLELNMIVLLDIQFSATDIENGHSILKKISDRSELIPVILWSGINETEESFSDFINNNAFGFISKDATIQESFILIDKALTFLKTNLDNIIEDWIIQKDEDKNVPIYMTSNGKEFSLNDILKEIRTQSEIGKDFSRKLNSLTIDLLLRKKENLHG
ncbi:response regulator [Flavobacterium pectinovorum]|uniref:response regulator n=1 Tax=Flavobacterium pectinovorum TaxID=29533 RepID=UPI002660438B|nr:response regulator [Flavobacterium pectinovorum]WKL47033.1 response regulator [Flavobacterium pectinovorum]